MLTGIFRGAERIVALVAAVLRASIIAAMGLMLACIAIQVVMRYVFGKTPSWSEEMALLMFSWATLGGLALGVREGFHVRFDLIVNNLPPRLHRWLEAAIEALTAVFGAFMAWSGLRFVDMTGGSVSAAIGYPIEFLHVLAFVSGAMICLFSTWRLLAGPSTEPTPELAP